MSFNQSRPDKSETQYRKPGRSGSFNQQRSSSGAYGRGSGGPAPSPSLSYNNRSFKKVNNNAHGGQSRAPSVPNVNSSLDGNASTPRGVQNGAHIQPQLLGATDTPASIQAAKQAEPSAATRSTRGVPKAPTSQHAPVSSNTTATTATPTKAPGDGSKPFLQFGSISPGFVNGMQIPARTSSAPPNLDEQKRDQARQDAFRAAPALPTPVPKQHFPRKDLGAVDRLNTPEAHPMAKVKKDVQVPSAPPANQTQKPTGLQMAGMSIPIQFHQSPVSMPFGGHNQQMPSQGVAGSSLQMPMPLPIGSATQVQQQVFVPGLQPHPMQHQGLMHQGQNLSFSNPMAQLAPQMGNLGISIGPQYPQQQAGKFSAPRKTAVKITNPKTHEEVIFYKRTDGYSDGGSSSLRPHPNVPQSQPIQSYAASHPMNFYTNPYAPGSIYFPTPNSIPLPGAQIPPSSQAARYSYPSNQGPQNVKISNPSALNAVPTNKSGTHVHGILEPPNLEHSRDTKNLISSAPSAPTNVVTVKPSSVSLAEKLDSLTKKSTTVEKGEPNPSGPSGQMNQSHLSRDNEISTDRSSQQSKSGSESVVSESIVGTNQSSGRVPAVPLEDQVSTSGIYSSTVPSDSVSVTAIAESRKKESLSRSNSIKDQQKRPVKKGVSQSQHQVGGQGISVSSMPSETLEYGPSSESVSSESGVSESVEFIATLPPVVINEDVPKATEESLSTSMAAATDAFVTKAEGSTESNVYISSESSVLTVVDTSGSIQNGRRDASLPDNQVKYNSAETKEQGSTSLSEGPNDDFSTEVSSELNSIREFVGSDKHAAQEVLSEETATNIYDPPLEATKESVNEPETRSTEDDLVGDKLAEDPSAENSSTDASLFTGDRISEEVSVLTSGNSNQQSQHVASEIPKHEGRSTEIGGSGGSTEDVAAGVPVPAGPKDKPLPELTRSKSVSNKGKKKRKEVCQKADAAGTTSDLYMAYKSLEEKKESLVASDFAESTSSSIISKQLPTDLAFEDAAMIEKDGGKAEPDNWEDAADISKPKLESEDDGGVALHDKDGGNMIKKYSRDFLLKFSEQCTDIPVNFEIPADIAELLMSPHANASHVVDRSSFPSPARVIDRPGGAPRLDRRNSGVAEDDRWNKLQNAFGVPRLDLSFGPNPGFRPGQVANFGVLRNPRVQTSVPYIGGILSGPMQSVGTPGGMQRNSPDADRWQRATNFQHRGLIPSPQTPLVTMHKTEKRYEVGKVTDEEETKQRQLKAILNKLTPQNFEKLFEQVKAVNIDNARTLRGVIGQIFDKALTEPTFCEMYANFCYHLSGELPDFSEDDDKITFKRLLLNKCQEEFERGEREQEEANKADEEGEVKQSKEEREEKRVKARRRMLGNIRLIGELYKKKMLTERIMHECIQKLLGQHQTPDEEDLEALCKLMSTIGESIDHPKAKEHMDAYFDRMKALSNNMKLSSRVRFMLRDSIDLRKNNWQQRRKVEGPKKIEEVHRDAAQERQAQASRLSRGPGINSSGRRGPTDFGTRGSTVISSPSSQLGSSFRTLPTQARNFASQDARVDERQAFVPLPQRLGDDITLGPQGGLARGMSSRGPPSMSPVSLTDISPSTDSRRVASVANGYSSVSDRGYSPREDLIPRVVSERFPGQVAYDQSSAQERNMYGRELRNSDPSIDRSLPSSPPSRGWGPTSAQSAPAEKTLSEERLREKSRTAIKEFYSARDVGEVALCIKDLNSPTFHPTMVSIWVTDSFEAKDMERELLANLLMDLATSSDSTLSQIQLVKGFESVLETLEDTVTDSPKAPQYLGRIFAKFITQHVVSLREIGQMIHESGEEPGSLLNSGLAGDVLGNILDIIKSEKGDATLKELIAGSSLRLETFRPPGSLKSRILEKFI